MRIEKDDNLPSGYRILGSSDSWDIEEDRLSIRVSDAKILPMSGDDMLIDIYGEGPRQIAEDIIELSRNIGREELDMLKAENEALKETIEVLQRQLEKEKHKRDARTYSVLPIIDHANKDNPNPELYSAIKILMARHNETLMENNRLRKRNNKFKQDFESVKGHLRTAQYKLNKYKKYKRYSEIFVDSHSGQSLTFKDAKVSISSNGDVTVSGQSVENLINRLKQLCETEKKFKKWGDIVLKQVEANPDIFNEHIKEN